MPLGAAGLYLKLMSLDQQFQATPQCIRPYTLVFDYGMTSPQCLLDQDIFDLVYIVIQQISIVLHFPEEQSSIPISTRSPIMLSAAAAHKHTVRRSWFHHHKADVSVSSTIFLITEEFHNH